VQRRTQSSLAATADGRSWVLFNASPDLPAQIRATPELWPCDGRRHSPIAAVVLTNADVDHVAGLLSLRERHAFDLIALAPVHVTIAANAIFNVLAKGVVERRVAHDDEPIDIAGVQVALFPVPGKVPLYEEGPEPAIGVKSGETAGVDIATSQTKLVYVPGCAAIGDDLVRRLSDANLVLFDGTVFRDEEMIAAGVGDKTGRRMGHVPISGPDGSLARLGDLRARKIYVHVNNTNPILVEGSPERQAVERAGFEVAFDGLEIPL
jgi:pyrroloquinoline quinone biosynthesis protein B